MDDIVIFCGLRTFPNLYREKRRWWL